MAHHPQKRNVTLDVVRGIAVLLVVFNHTEIPRINTTGLGSSILSVLASIIHRLSIGGWIGVDLFFVLSGFLVSGLLFKEYQSTGRINAINFLIRRGFKIYPTFYFFLLIAFITDLLLHYFNQPMLFPPGNTNYSSWFISFLLPYGSTGLFLYNYLPGGAWPHTWSLDVEEHFYILLVIFFVLITRKRKITFNKLFLTYLLLLTGGIIARLYANMQHPAYDFKLHYSKTHFRLDSMLLGVVLSYLFHYKPEKLQIFKKYKYLIGTLSLLFLTTNFIFLREQNSWISIVSLAVNPICFGALLMISLYSDNRLLKSRPLAYIGTLSYGIYIWHFMMYMLLITFVPKLYTDQNFWLFFVALYFFASFLLAYLSTKLIEIPLLKYRNKRFPSKAPPPKIENRD